MGSELKRIGFVGLGSMGGDQARCLANLGIPLTVYDVNRAATEQFAGRADLADDLAGVARDADVVGICVQDDAQVLSCAEQLVPAMKSGAILMVHSTVKPSTMIAVGAQAQERGVTVLDASVTRTVMTKEGPFVFCMTGGDEAAVARARPVIDAYATDTLHVGALGSAMALKICNNLASWSAIMIGLEAFDLAEAAGVPLDKLLTVMKRNGVLTPPAQSFVAFRNEGGDDVMRGVMATQSGIGEKDLRLAEGLAADAGAQVPIAASIRAFVRERILELSAPR